MAKYGRLLGTRYRRYRTNYSQIWKLTREAIRCFETLQTRTPQINCAVALSRFQIEVSDSLVDCLRRGHIACAYVLLRTVQEISNRVFITKVRRDSVGKKLTPRQVREIISMAGYPDWKSYYSALCDVAHQNPDFTESYWTIQPSCKRSTLSDILVEECLVATNLFCAKSLGILYDLLAPFVGDDKRLLSERFTPIEQKVIADHKKMDGVVEQYIREHEGEL